MASGLKLHPLVAKNYDLASSMTKEMEKAMRNVVNEIREDFHRPVRSWEHKPRFKTRKIFTSTSMQAEVSMIDDGSEGAKHFVFVDEGVKPHEVAPKNSPRKVLKFPGTYHAKSIPGTLSSYHGSKGNKFVFTKQPVVVGIKARNFTGIIKANWETKFAADIEKAFELIAKDFNR